MRPCSLLARLEVGWDSIRYFSFEEDADDITVDVLALGRDPEASKEFPSFALPPDAADGCADVLRGAQVSGYGDNLLEEHHARCWRIVHRGRLAETGRPAAALQPAWPPSVRPVFAWPEPYGNSSRDGRVVEGEAPVEKVGTPDRCADPVRRMAAVSAHLPRLRPHGANHPPAAPSQACTRAPAGSIPRSL